MAETPSQMIPLGTLAPDFNLLDTRSNSYLSLQQCKSEIGTVIMFLCNHCPYVKYIFPQLIKVIESYQLKKISFVAICSNDAESYPEDGPLEMHAYAKKLNFSFPYLFDETQTIAKSYHAACTPDFYLFDKNLQCVYRGRFDESTPANNKEVTGADLCAALDNLLANKHINPNQKPSLGCNIKWKL